MDLFNKSMLQIILYLPLLLLLNCKEETINKQDDDDDEEEPTEMSFYFGADLSYVNQILDHNGVYKDEGEVRSPYRIFKDHGANLARFRLWHNPVWTKEVYGDDGTQLYNDLADVEKAIDLSKAQGMEVLLDFHYSDVWADPGTQEVPAAWKDIDDLEVLKDSVYQYTKKTLEYLDSKGLMPELVQVGNETNCGMMISETEPGFPDLNVCDGNWSNMGEVVNSAIRAIREVSENSDVDTKIVLHVADPANVEWWFENITTTGNVTDFDVIGFSYYPIWHTSIRISQLSSTVSSFKSTFNKEVMILETAYPWTTDGDDNYGNIFGGDEPLSGYPYTKQGQFDLITDMTQEMIDGGGNGIIYWEPAWISSDMKDLWGTGSSWENNVFFDFDGNTIQAIDFMSHEYEAE